MNGDFKNNIQVSCRLGFNRTHWSSSNLSELSGEMGCPGYILLVVLILTSTYIRYSKVGESKNNA